MYLKYVNEKWNVKRTTDGATGPTRLLGCTEAGAHYDSQQARQSVAFVRVG